MLKRINLPRTGVFLDLGCGKGRALILAAEFGFRSVVGVEFSELLCLIAKSNLSSYSKRYPGPIEFQVIHADAAEYVILKDVKTIFMFNSFGNAVMAKVVRNIEESLQQHPRKLWNIYANPLQRELFDNSGMFQVIAQHSFPQCDFLVYAAEDG